MKNNSVLSLAVFFIITTIVIYSWFNTKAIISNTSEENLNIFHSQKSAEYYFSFWQPVGTGYKTAFFVTRYPVFAVLGILEQVGIPAYLRQASLLGVIMLAGMISMYFLIKVGLKLGNLVALLGGLFYSLNIYSMTQVWKRFLYTHMVAWAYLPFFTFLWVKWINTKRLYWLIVFSFSSLFFTYAFSNPVFLLTIWTPVIIHILWELWTSRKNKKQLISITLQSLLGVILWSGVNFWWLYPTFTLGSSWASDAGQTLKIDFDSLRAVSMSFPIQEILLLRQSWYLGPSNDFNNFYHNPLVIFINIAVFLTFVYGVIKSKGYNFRGFLLIVWLIGFFVSKGTNFPFGHTFFYFLFSNFPLTTALRNSYEKFGIVFLLPYTVFFAIGFYKLITYFNFKLRIILSLILFTLFCGVLVYPIWTGDIFPPKDRVQVPSYYIEANNFLNSQKVERKFHMPFLTESIPMRYEWGYVGIDPLVNLFDGEDLSSADVPLYNKTLELLSGHFDNKHISNIFGLLGIQYIVLQRDIVYPLSDYSKLKKQIEVWEGIVHKIIFEKLDLYLIDPRLIRDRIYASGTIIRSNSLSDALKNVASDKWDTNSVFTYKDVDISLKDVVTPKISYQKISPTEYKIAIKESKGPYVLVLNNTYDRLWQAKIDKQIPAKHFMVNGFANGWLVDKAGDYNMEIKLVVWPWD